MQYKAILLKTYITFVDFSSQQARLALNYTIIGYNAGAEP